MKTFAGSKRRKDDEQKEDEFLPILSYARFGHGTILILSLIVVAGFVLYFEGLALYIIVLVILAVFIVLLRILVVIQPRTQDEKVLVGRKCLVIESMSKQRRGIVKLYNKDGLLDHELWSAETISGEVLEKGKEAKIVGLRSIILLVEPVKN